MSVSGGRHEPRQARDTARIEGRHHLAEAAVTALRRRTGFGSDRLFHLLGLPAATVHRVSAAMASAAAPGSASRSCGKKLGRIVDGPGHRATGDRGGQRGGAGWEVLHIAIDGATRLVHAELLPDERHQPQTNG